MNSYLCVAAVLFFLSDSFSAEAGRALPNALGIASPSISTLILGENPAGFSYLSGVKLQLLGQDNNDSIHTRNYNGGLYAGTSNFGFGIATGKTKTDTSESNPTTYWGLGGGIESVAIGANGSSTSNGSTTQTETQFGVLFGAKSALTIGGVFQSDVQSTYDWGAGFSYDLLPGANVAIDAKHKRSNGELAYAAGLRLASSEAELMLGYRVLDKNNSTEDHIIAGLSYFFNHSFGFQFMYNYTLKYLLGLTVRF